MNFAESLKGGARPKESNQDFLKDFFITVMSKGSRG